MLSRGGQAHEEAGHDKADHRAAAASQRRATMTASLRSTVVSYSALLVLSMWLAASATVTGVVTDTFHEGEYLGMVWHVKNYYQGLATFPLVIHGALNFAPSLAALAIYGPDHTIVGTRVINGPITGITWFLYLATFQRIRKLNGAPAWLMAFPIVLLVLFSLTISSAVELHHAFLNPRDVFLVMSVLSVLAYETTAPGYRRITFLLLTGLAGGLALFLELTRFRGHISM